MYVIKFVFSTSIRLTVGSGFDLNLSIRLEFSISIFQFDSKPDSDRIVKRSKLDSNWVESNYSTRLVKNSIFWSTIIIIKINLSWFEKKTYRDLKSKSIVSWKINLSWSEEKSIVIWRINFINFYYLILFYCIVILLS